MGMLVLLVLMLMLSTSKQKSSRPSISSGGFVERCLTVPFVILLFPISALLTESEVFDRSDFMQVVQLYLFDDEAFLIHNCDVT